MFDYTRDNYPNFKLFISLDLWAEGNAFNGVHIEYYHDLLQDFLGHPAWLLGPNNHPFISTYSSGGLTGPEWQAWKDTFANAMYFVPDFDDTLGYNTSDPGWWGYWENIVDGAMSWETTWPKPGVGTAGNIDEDSVIVAGTFQHRKSYMMRKFFQSLFAALLTSILAVALSPLQYKNSVRGQVNDRTYTLLTSHSMIRIITVMAISISLGEWMQFWKCQ